MSDHGCDPYRNAMMRLVAARDQYQSDAERLRHRHRQLRRRANAAVDRSAAAVAAAEAQVLAARALVDQVDADAAVIWRAALDVVPRSLANPGESLPVPTPPPASEQPGTSEGPAMAAARMLSGAQAALAQLRQRQRLSGRGYAALAALGAVSGAAGYGFAQLVAWFGHFVGQGAQAPAVGTGRFLALVAPVTGLPFAIRELERRGLRGGAMAGIVVLAAGAVVVYGGALLLRG